MGNNMIDYSKEIIHQLNYVSVARSVNWFHDLINSNWCTTGIVIFLRYSTDSQD